MSVKECCDGLKILSVTILSRSMATLFLYELRGSVAQLGKKKKLEENFKTHLKRPPKGWVTFWGHPEYHLVFPARKNFGLGPANRRRVGFFALHRVNNLSEDDSFGTQVY